MTEYRLQPLRTHRLLLAVQAQQKLLGLIQEGTYRPGDRLPSQDELALQLGISRPTLREALPGLEQQGLIVRRPGVGTFVAPCPPGTERLAAGLERLESIMEIAGHQGIEPGFESLEVEEAPAGEGLADRLQVQAGTPLTFIRRIIVVDGAPIAFMVDVAPASVLAPADIGPDFHGSVLDLLRRTNGAGPDYAVANIVALNADAEMAERLGLAPRDVILMLEETAYDQGGRVVEYSQNYYRPEVFRFHVVRR